MLRNVIEGDAGFLFRLMNDSAVREALGEPPTLQNDWEQAIAVWKEDPDEEGYLVCYRGEAVGWFSSLPTGTISRPGDAMRSAGSGLRRQWCRSSRTVGKCQGYGWNISLQDDKNTGSAKGAYIAGLWAE